MPHIISWLFRIVKRRFLFCEYGGFKSLRSDHLLARVAQLVEHQIVDLRVAGSCPVSCPIFSEKTGEWGVFLRCAPSGGTGPRTAGRRSVTAFRFKSYRSAWCTEGRFLVRNWAIFLRVPCEEKRREWSGGLRLTSSPRESCRGFRPSSARFSRPARQSAFSPSAPSSASTPSCGAP